MTGRSRSDGHYLAVSRGLTAVWGAVQIAVALAAIELSGRAVDEVLGIVSFTNGVILGIFLLGTLTRSVRQRAAFVGVGAGALTMLAVWMHTGVSWQWYVVVGSGATFAAGWLASLVVAEPTTELDPARQ